MLSFSLSLPLSLFETVQKTKKKIETKRLKKCCNLSRTHTLKHTRIQPPTHTHTHILIHTIAFIYLLVLFLFRALLFLILWVRFSPLFTSLFVRRLDAPAIAVPSPARRALHPRNVPHTARAQPRRQIAQSGNRRVACTSIMMISLPWPAARILVNIWPKANEKLPP